MVAALHSLALPTTRHFWGSTGPIFRATWLVGLVLLTLSSCSRATYVFSPGPQAYLATERPAPSEPGLAVPQIRPTDSLPPATSPHVPATNRRRAPKLRPPVATHAGGGLPTWTRPLATTLVAKRLGALAAARHRPHNTARYAGTAGPSGTLVVALCLLGAGLLGLLIGASISTNIVGAIFGVFLLALGSVAIVVGLVMLLVALLANE